MKSPALFAAAAMAVAAFATPSLASTESGFVPYCHVGNDAEAIKRQEWILATELQLASKRSGHIELWNGCFKVTITDASGTTITFYDPNSLAVIDRM